MRLFRSVRWVLLALVLSIVPASAFAGVFISVGFAPPPLPVYEQPPCPEPGWMWTPGYWAYGPDGYYWVPGAWVPAPYEGALWTPGYWGWGDSLYVWHAGYWGPHVGYYGGVNYGFGYMGIGFVGGRWHGHEFEYNRAVMHVDEHRIHNVYDDRRDIDRYTVRNDRRVAYSGGPGGINHAPGQQERMAMNERHMAPTSFQSQHVNAAMNDRGSYYKTNNGRPQTMAVQRPMGMQNQNAPNGNRGGQQPNSFNNGNHGAQQQFNRPPQYQHQNQQQYQNQPQYQTQQQFNRAPQYQNQNRQQTQSQPHYQNQPQAQPHYQSQPQGQPRNEGQPHGQGQQQQSHPQHEEHKQH